MPQFECKYAIGDHVEFRPGTGEICRGIIQAVKFYTELEPKYSIEPDSCKPQEYWDTFESSLTLLPNATKG